MLSRFIEYQNVTDRRTDRIAISIQTKTAVTWDGSDRRPSYWWSVDRNSSVVYRDRRVAAWYTRLRQMPHEWCITV